MIIIGYPGIGKTTLAGRDHKYIDLESSNFKINGERSEDWYKIYCKVAEDLSRQGYVVFVSCHSAIREALRDSGEDIAVICPIGMLEKKWITKLRYRYEKTNSDKDKMAYERARDHYNEDIVSLYNYPTRYQVWLTNMSYDLESEIIRMINCEIRKMIKKSENYLEKRIILPDSKNK